MSLSIILQERSRIFMSGDSAISATSITEKGARERIGNTGKKITKIGNDIVFTSGILKKSEAVLNFMKNFYDCYKVPIELDQLTTFLQNAIGMQSEQGVYDVGVLIGRIENGISVVYDLSQYNDFKVISHYGREKGVQVWCAGFKVKEATECATKHMEENLCVADIFVKTYEDVSCSEIGGTITVFEANQDCTKMILRQKINENKDRIKWFNGLGEIYNYEEAHAVSTDVLMGNMVMSEKLRIENKSGTWNLTDEGLEATSGLYSVGINPNVPTEIFNIKIGDEKQFFIDTLTGKLVMNGTVNAQGGTLGSLDVIGTLKGGKIEGSEISGVTINGSSFNSVGDNLGYISKSTIDNGVIKTHSINVYPMNIYTQDFVTDSNRLSINPGSITFSDSSGNTNLLLSDSGLVNAKNVITKNVTTDDITTDRINDLPAITPNNLNEFIQTDLVPTKLSSYGNIIFKNGVYGASTSWVEDYFAKKSALSALESKVAALEARVSALENK